MKKRLPKLASKQNCTGCMACVGACRIGALSMQLSDDGHGYPILDSEICAHCLHCEQVCQGTRNFIGNNDLHLSTPYAAWANDNVLRSHSTSGGFAAAVTKNFLRNNNGVIGVGFDGKRAAHIYVDNDEDSYKLQGSKYVWSDASEAYRAIAENLPVRQVLFIGTGCQVAGVLSCFANHPHYDRLYTIDLICGGVPSNLLIQVFSKTNPEVEVITSFRTKRRYELKGIINGKEVVLPKQSLPMSGFCAEQTMRYSCYNCPYTYAHRKSDITIGDLWGECSPEDQYKKGVSLVIVHSEKGLQMLQKTEVTVMPVEWDKILVNNRRLVYNHTPMTSLRRCLSDNYHQMNEEAFTRIYGNTSSIKHPIGFSLRVWIYLLRKLNERRAVKVVKRIIAGQSKQ